MAAAVDHAADADQIADLVLGHVAADGGHAADDLMPGTHGYWVPAHSPRAVCRSEWQTPQ